MKHHALLFGLACLACASFAKELPKPKITPPEPVADAAEMRLRIGGLGGVYFLAPVGELRITFYRMEWTERPEPLRLVLFSPNRQVLADYWLPGQGKAAGSKPILKTSLTCQVEATGIYGLMLSCPTDRYGLNLRWSFDTNCEKYLVETSGGHKDQRHQEPLTLTHYDNPGNVFFWPSPNDFQGGISQLLPSAEGTKILDDQGHIVQLLTPDEKGNADFSIPADAKRRPPWSISFGKMHGVLTLDNLTRWDKRTPFDALSLWTDKRSAWFDYYTNRKLLFPHNMRLNLPQGQKTTANFTLCNLGNSPKQVRLNLEFPDGTASFATLPFETATIPPRKQLALPIACASSGTPQSCRVRVTCGDFTTYSSLDIAPRPYDAEYAFDTPLLLKPYCHQNVTCAYYPDYPLDSQPYFDLRNQPYVLDSGYVKTFKNGRWQTASFTLPDGSSGPVSFPLSKIAFDKDNWAYVLIQYKQQNYLAFSADNGDSFSLVPFPASGAFDIEQFSGHNLPPGPPPVAVYRMLKNDPQRIWRAFFDFKLYVPVKKDGKITIPQPIQISDKSIGLSLHSGIPSTIASFNGKTYVIWGETTDPDDKSIPGVPTMLASYDHATGTLERSPVVGFGPPANDIHNTPCLTIDSQGYIHALVGTHGSTFIYSRSIKPNSIMDGWTPATPVGKNLGQTYLGLVCDRHDNLHMVFRLWGNDEHGLGARLAMMSKPALADKWTAPKVLVKAAFNDYSVFYHRFLIDRNGNFYLSFDYWSTYWFYRNDQLRNWRSLIVSKDEGEHWQMAPNF